MKNDASPIDEIRTCTFFQLAGLINLLLTWQEFWTRNRSVGRSFAYVEHNTEKYIHRAKVDTGIPVFGMSKAIGTLNCMLAVIGTAIILLEVT
jgi:hypothetical protein